eukprot:1325766-Pyramimonas_sp.AAC.1
MAELSAPTGARAPRRPPSLREGPPRGPSFVTEIPTGAMSALANILLTADQRFRWGDHQGARIWREHRGSGLMEMVWVAGWIRQIISPLNVRPKVIASRSRRARLNGPSDFGSTST